MRRIVVLEDDKDLRDLLCELLRRAGAASCLPFASVEAMKKDLQGIMLADLALLDVNLGPGKASGVDAFHWLRQSGFTGEVVFLTGHARFNPTVQDAYLLPQVRVLEKPVEARELQALATGIQR